MTKLEHIEDRLHHNNVTMYEFAIDETIKAMSVVAKGKKAIALNRDALSGKADETAILAEELGHFETNAFYKITPDYNTPAARNNRIKYEAMARNWAYREYCPPEEIEAAIASEGVYGVHAVADKCSVTVDFLHKSIAYHRSCGVEFNLDDSSA